MVTPCAMDPDNARVIIRASPGVKQVGSPGHLEDPVVGASLNFMPWAPCLLHPYPSPSDYPHGSMSERAILKTRIL